jgi:hypothetical protein
MYEHRSAPLLPTRQYVERLLQHAAAAALLVIVSVAIGMAGYEHFEHLAWRDAFLNAAMLLGGMGPVETPVTDDGKIFAGIYALYAGLVFLIAVATMFAPVLHRLLHRFHWSKGS